ncbi:hypothetical protein BJI67_11335 [Acidihalobacter aeolianus]|uniref:SAM-dependent chlorinase/fluorinase n=1 Tax=Acidihalobacter aeolianus TaxID=2792603 RepID=A0A1D8K9F9_9GAMM|nr:SAM-dependent chlorinase/fluorinase [Acidihalobacter aeolianus]AOV17575.1 hypothetical protein BJI67_11335 [Acidihalobacter aeolianus]
MIHLFTDFGVTGPYLGQMQARLLRDAPGVPMVNLLADAPAFDPVRSAYLLAAFTRDLPPGDVVLGVVDPGVGSPRAGIVLNVDGVWYVGPDNGLFEIAARQGQAASWWTLPSPDGPVSRTFHGRDWFAPMAAKLVQGRWRPDGSGVPLPPSGGHELPEDLYEVVYVDVYGNLVTGLSGAHFPHESLFRVGGRMLALADTFSAVLEGAVFWYVNANGLVEFAANRARACDVLGLGIGAPIGLST